MTGTIGRRELLAALGGAAAALAARGARAATRAHGTDQAGRSPETIGSTCRNTATPDCFSGSSRSCVHEHADAPHALGLLRACRERPCRRCAAECGQQFPPSDGACHTPLPCEVRKKKDTTARACCPNSAAPGAGGAS